jgi:hypothetical protein
MKTYAKRNFSNTFKLNVTSPKVGKQPSPLLLLRMLTYNTHALMLS